MYSCAKCGLAVAIVPGKEPIKACECDAPIIANMSASMDGAGGVKVK